MSVFQKSSQMPTLTLKFSNTPGFVLAVTNFSMSGCHASRIPMLAPRRLPPCLTTSVMVSMMRINDVGPDATPQVGVVYAHSAARLEDHGCVSGRFHDAYHVIGHVKHKAC